MADPKPWETPGTLPTDEAAAAAAQAAAQAAASTPTPTPGANDAPAGTQASAGGVGVVTAPEVASEVTVTAIVPKAFTLRLASKNGEEVVHHEFKYPAGTQEMLYDHATHWWAKANGVTIYTKA